MSYSQDSEPFYQEVDIGSNDEFTIGTITNSDDTRCPLDPVTICEGSDTSTCTRHPDLIDTENGIEANDYSKHGIY